MPQTHRDKHIYVVCVLCNTNLVSDLQWWSPVHCDVCNELWRERTAREAAHQCWSVCVHVCRVQSATLVVRALGHIQLAVSLDVQCSVSSMLPFLLCIVCVLKYAAHTVAVKFCNTCPMSTAGAAAGAGEGGEEGGGEGGAVNIAHLANSCSLPCAQILHLFPPIPDGWEM